jgi:hypothetical protein
MKSIVIRLLVISLPVFALAGETGGSPLVPPSEKIAGQSQVT